MSTLLSLPDGILINILTFFLPHEATEWQGLREGRIENQTKIYDKDDYQVSDGYGDLYTTCLVAKKLRGVAQPLLFQNFADHALDRHNGMTVSFAKALNRRPELGKFLQDLTISAPFDPEPYEISKEDIQFFTNAIKDLDLGKAEKTWIIAMELGDVSIFAALILKKTPNIRRMILPGGLLSMSPFSTLLRQGPSFLPNLENVCFIGNDDYCGYNIATYLEFLTLSKLKTAVFSYGDLQAENFSFKLEPKSSVVEELVFDNCEIDNLCLQKLTGVFKNLKSFSYDSFAFDFGIALSRPPDTYRGSQFNAAHAHEALFEHRETLEYLRLDFARKATDLDDLPRFISNQTKMPSLREFTVLENVRLQQAIVPDHPQFYPALKRLVLSDCNSSVVKTAENIAADCKENMYPDLASFTILTLDLGKAIPVSGHHNAESKTEADLVAPFKENMVKFGIFVSRRPAIEELMERLALDG
ncbi:hypothetical protein N7466_001694 [Penicillium verhagenii]|uniref:uncharacterized protein n=1 Tax=Penicillium verhagenii TaxID=1562060 RepID=UPI00254571ED|nr:uncharacterized protein N7466_001694 [Penicillium verhagenii]KAJ5938560.1 hypothetical protein N7466_001694 [Penicillium verhagenii]